MMPGREAPVPVCMLIWNFHPATGGAEIQCLRLSRELAGRGLEVTVVTRLLPGTRPREDLDGLRIIRIAVPAWPARIFDRLFGFTPGGPERGAVGQRPSPSKLLRLVFSRLIPESAFCFKALNGLYRMRRDFAILHVHEGHWIAALGVAAARLLGKKSLVKEATTGSKGSLRSLSFPLRAMAARADAYPAVSRYIASDLSACGIPPGRIRVIPNGIHLPAQSWTGGDADAPTVLFVGNLSQQPMKGIDLLLEAWAHAEPAFPQVRLQLVGGGNAAPMKALAERLGIAARVDFLGSRDDVQARLLACRLFVLPSRNEGMSNALLEAMALGVPCVATDISGSQDLIWHGASGLLVPPGDPEALGRALLRALGDPAEAARLGSAARSVVAERCDMPKVAQRYLEWYRELAGSGP